MKEHIMTCGQIETEKTKMELCYRMFEHPGEGRSRYGVVVENVSSGECAAVEDVTSDPRRAEELLSLLARGNVTPVCLREVVEDFVAG